MGYRIRVLGRNFTSIPLADLQRVAEPAVLEADEGVGDAWETLVLKHVDGDEIVFIEKNPVVPGELGAEELQEFIDEVGHYKPAAAATWLHQYLPQVKVIYSFQFLSGTESDNGFELMQKVYGAIWNSAGGILQADGEGFSNEDGFTILWQFSDDVSGPWNVAVPTSDGEWTNYEMDLGNQDHREAFFRGEVPDGVT